jgi:hypothetical protein
VHRPPHLPWHVNSFMATQPRSHPESEKTIRAIRAIRLPPPPPLPRPRPPPRRGGRGRKALGRDASRRISCTQVCKKLHNDRSLCVSGKNILLPAAARKPHVRARYGCAIRQGRQVNDKRAATIYKPCRGILDYSPDFRSPTSPGTTLKRSQVSGRYGKDVLSRIRAPSPGCRFMRLRSRVHKVVAVVYTAYRM